MSKRNYILVFILVALFGKSQVFPWAKSASRTGGGSGEGYSVSTDASGNVFITGDYTGPAIAFGTNTLTNSGSGSAIFLTKYDANGNVLWAKGAGGISGDGAYSVCNDPSGNAFISGYFTSSTIAFGTNTLSSIGSSGIFITKYNVSGVALWAKSPGGTGTNYATGTSADATGNVFITGNYSSPSLSFGTTTLTNTSGNSSLFIAKYDANGNVLWAKSSTGTNPDYSNSVSTDAGGNAFITGTFNSPTVAFGTNTLTNTGAGAAVFLVKYDPNGNVLWAKTAGGISSDEGRSVSSDASGNSFITGEFSSPNIIFGTYTLTNVGVSNLFITKYDSNGNVLWAKGVGGSTNDIGYSISTYSSGVYVTGSFNSPTIAFGTNTLTPPLGSTDPMFVALYDLNGNAICAEALSSGADDQNGISADNFGNAYVTGDFFSNPFIVGTNILTLTGTEDIFVAKFNCQPNVGIKTVSQNLPSKLFPNPNNGFFKLQIDFEISNGEIVLFNSLGQKVHSQTVMQGSNTINTTCLAKGLYNYILIQDKEKVNNGKLVIE